MMKLEELVRQLQLAFGNGLRSVVLFGSAVAGEHNPKKSDYNILVIVDSLPLERLRAVAAVSKACSGWEPAAADVHGERMEILVGHFSDGVCRHSRAAPSAVRRSAIRWDSGVAVRSAAAGREPDDGEVVAASSGGDGCRRGQSPAPRGGRAWSEHGCGRPSPDIG